jgi:hypothetical protein
VAAQDQPPPTQEQQPAAQVQQPANPSQQPVTRDQAPTPRGQQAATAQPAKITMSGCIQNAPPAAVASGEAAPPAGAAPSTPAASKFELASAKIVSESPVGTSGTATSVTKYRLEGEEKAITPHLNHQVEITGTLSPAATGATSATVAPMLKVESVKMVAAKCS